MEEKNWKILAIYMFNLSIRDITLQQHVGTKYDEKCTSKVRFVKFYLKEKQGKETLLFHTHL